MDATCTAPPPCQPARARGVSRPSQSRAGAGTRRPPPSWPRPWESTSRPLRCPRRAARAAETWGVAVQVAFGRQILKPVFHLIGSRVQKRLRKVKKRLRKGETRRFQAMGKLYSTCIAPPGCTPRSRRVFFGNLRPLQTRGAERGRAVM